MNRNPTNVFSHIIGNSDVGKRLDEFLAGKFTYYTLDRWQKEIDENNIKVSGSFQKNSYSLREKDTILFIPMERVEREVDKIFSIVFEDDYFLGVNKNGNLPVHPSGRYQNNNLVSLLAKDRNEQLYLANRIDRETSGIVMFGKTAEATRALQFLFQKREIKKTYIVYVFGKFQDTLDATGFLSKDKNSRIIKKKAFFLEPPDGNSITCKTYFEKISEERGISKLLAFPQTGRIHQIRATLFSLGFPVVGDKIYGKDESVFLDFIESGFSDDLHLRTGGKRQALHSYKLEYVHPFTKINTEIVCDEPPDIKIF